MTDIEVTYCDGIYREGDVRIMDRSGDRRLPIGDDGFERLAPRSVFVDKSMLVADLLNSDYAVTLFCRPRRFGKTLAMTMLKSFFELPPDGVSRAPLFEGLRIWGAKGGRYRAEQGVRPVIYLSLNDVKKGSWEECYQSTTATVSATPISTTPGVCSTIFQSVVGPGSTGPTRPATPWWETPFARPTARACATSTSCYSRAVWYGGPST